MMKYVLVSLVLLLFPLINAHSLLGSLLPEASDHVPIENHLTDNALRALEGAVDDAASKHCHKSGCDKSAIGYFKHLVAWVMDQLD